MITITIEEKKEITRDTMDRLLYCKGYKEELIELNKKFDPHKEVKYSYSSENFRFPLEKAI